MNNTKLFGCSGLIPVCLWVEGSLCEESRVLLGGYPQLVVERVMPDLEMGFVRTKLSSVHCMKTDVIKITFEIYYECTIG